MSIKLERSALLTQEQKDMLFFIYQEEKVARDVYRTLSKIHENEGTFAMMDRVEQMHLECAKGLCDRYGVETSKVNEEHVGQFESPVLQTLYDECIEKGKSSLIDALEVGEFLETTDITELEQASIGMPSDVVYVYNKLKNKNITHLGAFQSAILKAA